MSKSTAASRARSVHRSPLPVIMILMLPVNGTADERFQHNGVDKVYHPYVQPLETELEYRSIYQTDGDELEDGVARHRLALGRAVTDRVFVEGYLIGEETPQDSFRLDGWELETRVQLTEQGEYWADWGILFEFERERSESITEAAAVILMEKEISPAWVTTLNFGTEYEFGSDIDNEWDFDLALQLRYRFSQRFEPSLEYYADEFTSAVGPVFQGVERLGIARRLYWEAGVLFPLNKTTPDSTYRFLIELEF